jgi:hypothetical protein
VSYHKIIHVTKIDRLIIFSGIYSEGLSPVIARVLHEYLALENESRGLFVYVMTISQLNRLIE